MAFMAKSRALPITMLMIGQLTILSGMASAIVPAQGESTLTSLAFSSERLEARPALEPVEDVQSAIGASVRNGWADFRVQHGDWSAIVDKRTGRIEIAEGTGIPFVPGRGNKLSKSDIALHLGGKGKPDLAAMDSITRAFLPRVAPLLGVDAKSLKLNLGRSGQPEEHIWFMEYDVVRGGMAVEGARVVFRVNNGNLIQFGVENLPAPGAQAPKAKLTRDQALANLADFIGGFRGADLFIDNGTLKLLPVRTEDVRFADGFAIGNGRGLATAWTFTFRRDGEHETWRARVDAVTGEVIELIDTNHYAQVTGGAKFLGVSSNVPMPFANVSSGGFANSAGVYNYTSGTVTSSLAGQYVRITDNCGSISQSSVTGGNIAFGGTTGTDCTTPGSGGSGNTFSARGQFYHVNRAKEAARGWLPSNTWLNAQLTANVNINLTCNAFWNGSTINFYRSGGGCGNTGEIEGVSLHEYGHGLDSNDGGGSSPDLGTGETYGDWTAALATHTSCIGSGFLTSNCGGYGDACTSCTGVRDIDWGKHATNTPHTAANFISPKCPTSATYKGPCGKEGHCESYVSSEALWDFVNRDLPSPGSGAAWTVADRLWYLSRSTASAAFACSSFVTNGCNTGSLWKTMRAVDDDDGNLANGTPNSAALYAAFNRHGIACTSDAGASTSFRGCAQPAVPTLTLTAGSNQVTVASSSVTGVFDVYRNERGCNAGFTKVANDRTTALVDTGVADGFTYYYQIVNHPSGNESCASAPSTCLSVTPAAAPCTPPAAPTGLTATAAGANQVNLSWTASTGATSYNVYRATTSGGPYSLVGTSAGTTFANTGAACNTTYYYVVRAANGGTCESGNSTQASATTAVCPSCTTTNLYNSNGFETGTGLAGWSTGTFVSGGSTTSWRGIQTCTAAAGTKIFRFGGSTCTADYGSNAFTYAQPGGTTGVAVPAGSTTTRLTFAHRRAFETGYDGGTLAVSLNGTNYTLVPASAILSGTTYNGTVAASCAPAGSAGTAIFTGTASTFGTTTVNLDAVCNTITGGTAGCAGQNVRVGFTSISDCSVTGDGWFLDNVTVSACTP
jgi:hypothetical protein